MKRQKHFETSVIHDGYDPEDMMGSVSPPLFQTASFVFESAEQGERRFLGNEEGYMYSRLGNPTVEALERKIAALENGEKGLAFSSGMAAISAVLIAMTKANDHILCSPGLYGGTFGLLQLLKEKYNITHQFSNMKSKEEVIKQINEQTALIYVETPSNPAMRLIDLQMVTDVAKEYGIPVVVDNTFSSPYLQRPLDLGCDVVVHSATKYLGGHGDVIAGLVVGKKDLMETVKKAGQQSVGSVLAPFHAWLLMRGLKTLPVRLDRHSDNAEYIFEKLKQHPKVAHVYYPNDPEHPDYAICKKQMKRGGGMISFEIYGTKQDVQKMLNQLSFIRLAVSLGDTETLIQHPATMTHASMSEAARQKMGITEQMIRLSVGLESAIDIWEDLKQALDQI